MAKVFIFVVFLLLLRESSGNLVTIGELLKYAECLENKMKESSVYSPEDFEEIDVVKFPIMSTAKRSPDKTMSRYQKNILMSAMVKLMATSDFEKKNEHKLNMEQCFLFVMGKIDDGFMKKIEEMANSELNKLMSQTSSSQALLETPQSSLQVPAEIQLSFAEPPFEKIAIPNQDTTLSSNPVSVNDVRSSIVVSRPEPSLFEPLVSVFDGQSSALTTSSESQIFSGIPSEATYSLSGNAAVDYVSFPSDVPNVIISRTDQPLQSELSASRPDTVITSLQLENQGIAPFDKSAVLSSLGAQQASAVQKRLEAPLPVASTDQFMQILNDGLSKSNEVASIFCCGANPEAVSRLSLNVFNMSFNGLGVTPAFKFASKISKTLSDMPPDVACSKYPTVISRRITKILQFRGLLNNFDAGTIVDTMSANFRYLVGYEEPSQPESLLSETPQDGSATFKNEILPSPNHLNYEMFVSSYNPNEYVDSLTGKAEYYEKTVQGMLDIIASARYQMRSNDFNLDEMCETINGLAKLLEIPSLETCRRTTVIDFLLRIIEVTLVAFKGTLGTI